MSMLRGAAGCVGVGATSAASEAFSHVFSSTLTPRDQLLSPSTFPRRNPISHLPSRSSVITQRDEAENGEDSVSEESPERPVGHLVFAPAPTEEEVEDATKDFRAALDFPSPVSGSSLDGSADEVYLGVQGNRLLKGDPGLLLKMRDKQQARDKLLKPSPSHLGMLAAGSSVYQAFHLMRTNPQIQVTVKSLACDPAVWKAVLENEKVQELAQSLQIMAETSSHNELLYGEFANSDINGCLKLASKVLVGISAKVLQLMDKIVEIVGSIFEYVERSFSNKGAHVVDKTVASCLMLAVVVLLVVIIKRIALKSTVA